MRITNNMLSQNLLRNLGAAQGRLDYIQSKMSSGNKISRPSDDPVGIENALRIKSSISAVEQWKSNANEALAYMDTTDSTLGDMTSMLHRVRELAVQGANGTLSVEDKEKVALEVDQLADQFKLMANTKIGSKYIFAGTNTNNEPLPSSATTWQGNDQNVSFEVGSSLQLPITVKGTELFQIQADGSSAFFDTLSNLSAALRDPTKAAEVTGYIGEIEGLTDNVVEQRANLGARVNRMEALRDQLDSTSLNLTENLSSLMDADIAQTIIEFKNQENVYRAALSVGAQIIQPSLVDFMR
ncbi:MAG: flagellar hook-associated protein FlgL [Desulfitobacterium hafniense]|nr:flagellar hook-associated protein FlgL [Desulfitobacterium hafniense]